MLAMRPALNVIYRVTIFIAALCVIGLTAEVVYLQAVVGRAVSQFEQRLGDNGTPAADTPDPDPSLAPSPTGRPSPQVTGCPFGPDQCGG